MIQLPIATRMASNEFIAQKQELTTSVELIQIELSNGRFIVFDENVARKIVDEYRMIAEPVGTCPDGKGDITRQSAPYSLLPEQVSVLIEYVVRLKEINGVPIGATSKILRNEQREKADVQLSENEIRHRAIQIVKGRKVKQMKRQLIGADCGSAALKVRRCDLKDVEVSLEEINEVMQELSEASEQLKSSSKSAEILHIPLFDIDPRSYESIESPPFPETIEYRLRLNTFRELWRRGYYLTDGLKFGCDFLAYESPPGTVHSRWLVKCVDSLHLLNPLDLIALSRLASQVNKRVLLSIIAPDSISPYFIDYSWWKPDSM